MQTTAPHGTRARPAFAGRSVFPSDAVARIFRPSRPATSSGRATTKRWRLAFERRSPQFIEPLMGWTGGDDVLTQVELTFPTLAAAIAYAERQGLDYVVEHPAGAGALGDIIVPDRTDGARAATAVATSRSDRPPWRAATDAVRPGAPDRAAEPAAPATSPPSSGLPRAA